MKKSQPGIVGFEDRVEVTGAMECRQPPEAGKGKEIEPPLKSPERNVTLPTP